MDLNLDMGVGILQKIIDFKYSFVLFLLGASLSGSLLCTRVALTVGVKISTSVQSIHGDGNN